MKWYGLKTYQKKKIITNNKKLINSNNKKNLFFFTNNININNFVFTLYFPFNWNFLLLKKKYKFKNLFSIYLYSLTYFFFLPFNFYFLKFNFNKNFNTINLTFFYKNNYFNYFYYQFKIIFYSFSKLFFKKLKFKGKGYYIYKNFRNTIALQFGYSHIKRLYFYFSYVKFLSKTSILIFGINIKNINKIGYSLFNTKTINIFTGKGMRFNKQMLYRKTGKISSYR